MSSLPWNAWLLGTLVSIAGLALLVLNAWWSPATRRTGKIIHWLVGFGVNGLGMIAIGSGWFFLASLGPRWSLSWLFWGGLGAAVAGGGLYLASAARVGRLHAPSSYSNDLVTGGLYSVVRHPQALALALLAIGLGGISRSIPYSISAPLFVAGWYVYSLLEEKFEMIPVFGDRYVSYCRSTPRMFPSLLSAGRLLSLVIARLLEPLGRKRHRRIAQKPSPRGERV